MSKKKHRADERINQSAPTRADATTYTLALKPRPKLLVFFAVIFALWVGLLLTLYFVTIYPHRGDRFQPSELDIGAQK